MKKVTRWFRQYFCKHNWIMIRNPETENFIRKNEKNYVSIYSYWLEYQCPKCGKITNEQINTHFL